MKVASAQYAKALYEATKNKKHQEIDESVLNFVKTLAGSNQLRLKNDIIKKFSEVFNQENNIIEAEIISREKLSGALINKLIKFLKDKYQVKEVVVNNKIEESVVSGVIIKVNDEVLDGSVSRQLAELRNVLVKS